MNTNIKFGQALEALKEGKRITREEWGTGVFVFMQIPSTIPEEIIPKMQSLPQSVKDKFAKQGGPICYSNQFCIVHSTNEINGWVASPSDISAENWCILD